MFTCVLTVVNVFPVCSESEPWCGGAPEGEACTLLLPAGENQAEEMNGTPLISHTSNSSHWLSNQPWLVYAYGLLAVVIVYILCHVRVTLHGSTLTVQQSYLSNPLRSRSSVFRRVRGEIILPRKDLTCLPLHTPSILFTVALPKQGGEERHNSGTHWLVNKYSVLVPVRCSLPSNTLSVCFRLQSGTVTSCLPHTAFVN